MTSCELKHLALEWLRFSKRASSVATECGYWLADVAGVSATQLIEIETKISASDLKLDKSKSKHAYYRSGCGLWTPNLFYILVPEELEALAMFEANSINAKYGVMVVRQYEGRLPFVSVVKRAATLHLTLPSERVRTELLLRMGSELCSFHKRRADLRRCGANTEISGR